MGSLHHWLFCTTGGMARECLTGRHDFKQNIPYSLVVSWLCTRLSYASFRAAVMWICEAGHHIVMHPIYKHVLTTVQGKISCIINFLKIKKNFSNTLCFVFE